MRSLSQCETQIVIAVVGVAIVSKSESRPARSSGPRPWTAGVKLSFISVETIGPRPFVCFRLTGPRPDPRLKITIALVALAHFCGVRAVISEARAEREAPGF